MKTNTDCNVPKESIYDQCMHFIPGSSRHVNVLPFGRFCFFGEKAQILHTWKIQVCIYLHLAQKNQPKSHGSEMNLAPQAESETSYSTRPGVGQAISVMPGPTGYPRHSNTSSDGEFWGLNGCFQK